MAAQSLTADTSVIVPSLLKWHAQHDAAVSALTEVRRVPCHALVEAFSVLTRLPGQRALRPAQAQQVLLHAFPDEPLVLNAGGHLAAIRRLVEAGIGGGRIYDAIVGATVASAGARLVTADRRALATYALVGADVQLLE